MTPLLPLFPLGTVLLPGAPLSLHVFEERYRRLMADLLAEPRPQQRFGVVLIREGHEVGADRVRATYDVGCVAHIHQATPAADGTYAVTAVGTARFQVRAVDRRAAYLRAAVDWLPEETGDSEQPFAAVSRLFAAYRELLGAAIDPVELPADPRLLSYLVAATVLADPPDRQQFLAAPDAGARLAAEAAWLHREVGLLRRLRTVPAGRLLDTPPSMN
ncbi:MAG TPA: LON peptidase substrate-binding domain-containing protein [Mycobacteriales bacterium]|nr:LON peptidase substrate-binding domain-containing protein [Mycobacteriales bacterium]